MAQYPDKHFDLAIVDPPYRDKNQPTKDMRKNGGKMDDFGKKPDNAYFQELFRVSKNQIIWGANNFQLYGYKGFVIWEKLSISDTFTMSMAELAYISEGLGTTSKIFKYIPQDPLRISPTQKPVALYKWLLSKYAKQGDKILDTHFGSGSIAVACNELGFNLIASEIDQDYFNAACLRVREANKQGDLFREAV